MAGVVKYLLLVVLAVCVTLWLRRQRRRATHALPPQAQTMVCCAHCGVHVPKNLALHHQGRTYCCVAHCNSELSS